MLRHRNLFVVLFAVSTTLIFSEQSQAACAWILWTKLKIVVLLDSSKSKSDGWQVLQSLDDKKQCMAVLQAQVKAGAAEWQKPSAGGPQTKTDVNLQDTHGIIVHTVYGENGNISFLNDEYLCVPDTIDPRGKK